MAVGGAAAAVVEAAPAVDREAALTMAGGDAELLKHLIECFLRESPDLLAALRAAVRGSNGPQLQRAAHTVKGAVAIFGAHGARDRAQRLELMGRHNDFSQAPDELHALEHDLDAVKQDLEVLLAAQSPATR
jgi:HPt (histidine-containing phosphotransfer) domain-containing protein